MKFIDTNILVRYLLGDVPSQSEFIIDLFDQTLISQESLFILNEVLVELNYVLLKHYQIDKKIVIEMIKQVLDLGFISLVEKSGIDFDKVLNHYEQFNISIEDCMYLQYSIENNLELITFDKKLVNHWKSLR